MALNKDSQDRLNAIKQEEQLQRSLQKMLSDRVTKGKELTNSQKELSETLLKTNDLYYCFIKRTVILLIRG